MFGSALLCRWKKMANSSLSTNLKPGVNTVASYLTVSGVLNGLSTPVKCLCMLLSVGYLLSFSSTALDLLTVSPGKLMPPNFWIWTIVTHSFVEAHCWILLWDIAVLVLFSRYFEPLWTGIEVLRFFAIVTLLPVILSSATYLGWYLVLRDPDLLFDNHLHGLAAFIAALTVAMKQMEPDAMLFTSSFVRLRRRHIPLGLLCVSAVLLVINVVDPPFPILFFWGLIVSWVYLRYYQPHTGNRRGDMADSFAFATFFPDRMQPFVAVLSNSVYALLVSMKVCKKVTRSYEMTAAQTPVIVTLPGTDVHDAERRRQLALKALNERLRRVPAGSSSTSWPSMDEEDESAANATGRVLLPAAGRVDNSSPSVLPTATGINTDLADISGSVPAAATGSSDAVADQQ